MSRIVKVLKVFRRKCASHRSDEAEEFYEGYKNLKLNQLKFQKDDNVPIFLKGGEFDKILFYTTLGLCGLGLARSFGFIIGMAFPGKKDKLKASPDDENPSI